MNLSENSSFLATVAPYIEGTCSYVVVPLCITLGIAGNILSLIVLKEKAREDEAFFYQIGIIANDIVSICAMCLHSVCFFILDLNANEPSSLVYRRSFVLMFYFTHCSSTLAGTTVAGGLFSLIWITSDRIFAINKPVDYAIREHKKRFKQMLICTYIAGFLVSVHNAFDRHMVFDQTSEAYIVEHSEFPTTTIGALLGGIEGLVRWIILAALGVLSSVLVLKYKKVMTERRKKLAQNQNVQQPVHEKMLGKLLLSQNALVFISNISGMGMVVVIASGADQVPHAVYKGFVAWAVIAALVMSSANCLFYAIMSREFRKAAIEKIKKITP